MAVPLFLFFGLVMVFTPACGGSGGGSDPPSTTTPDGEPPVATPAQPQLPSGYPSEVAHGTLSTSAKWTLMETGRGRLCLEVTLAGSGESGCTDLTSTWIVGSMTLSTGDNTTQLVYFALGCAAKEVALRRKGDIVDGAEATLVDDVSYGVIEGPATLDQVELVAFDHRGKELFALDRLDGEDPGARVPEVAC